MVSEVCIEEGCTRPVKVKKRGLCHNHYQIWARHNRPRADKGCAVSECPKTHYAKGFCQNHYSVWKRMGTPTPVKEKQVCECGAEVVARGMCKHCYARDYYHNGPESRKDAYKDVVGYHQAHIRVSQARGKASAYKCVNCDDQAKEWALKHTATDLHFGVTAYNRESNDIAAYSLDVNDYQPMCIACHRAYDTQHKNRSFKTEPSRWDKTCSTCGKTDNYKKFVLGTDKKKDECRDCYRKRVLEDPKADGRVTHGQNIRMQRYDEFRQFLEGIE